MKLSRLLALAGIDYPEGVSDREITGIVTDSRKVVAGAMFIALKGLRSDGHDFIKTAIEAGASVIVAERVRDACVGGAAIILVDSTRIAAALLYNAWYERPSDKMRFIGITGTNGKTTVSRMIYALLERSGVKSGLIGTLGAYFGDLERFEGTVQDPLANMTTPDVEELYFILAKMAERGIETVVMEVSSHALALGKTDALSFDVGVFTNLTQDHLDFHGDMESYFLAKKRLLLRCRRAVVNIDDSYGKRIFDERPDMSVSCSLRGAGDFFASRIQRRGTDGYSFSIENGGARRDVELSLCGEFNVMNALEAFAAVSEYSGESNFSSEIAAALFSSFSGAEGRMEAAYKGEFFAYIDYAHTPDALENLLKEARKMAGEGRVILVFGCGGDRDRSKRKEMGRIATRYADLTVITSDNSRSESAEEIFSQIMKGVDKEREHTIIQSRKDAIEYAVLHARARDIVLLAGKGHERYEIDRSGRHYFDEREILREAIGKKYGSMELTRRNSGKESQ